MESSSAKLLVSLLLYSVPSSLSRQKNRPPVSDVRDRNGELKLRIILDRFSAEVFVNDGEQVLSMTFYTPLSADGISFEAKGKALIDVE